MNCARLDVSNTTFTQCNQRNIYQPLAVAIALALSSAAQATTFTVANTNDSGTGSLRQAVIDANGAAGADTVVFSSALKNKTITLTTGEIEVSDELVISGPTTGDAESIVIDGNANSRIFNGTTNKKISLENLTLKNGKGILPLSFEPNGGGAIRSDGALSLLNSTITNNKTFIEGYGEQSSSAVFSKTDITLFDSNIFNNSGTGVYAIGTVSFDHSKATENLLNGIQAETVIINNSLISGNSGTGIRGNTLTLKESTISDNDTGINGKTIKINQTTISDNKGIGLFVDNTVIFDTGSVEINQSTISGNQGVGLRGVDTDFLINQSTITNNSGGGAYISTYYYPTSSSNFTLNNTILSGNTGFNLKTSQYYSSDDKIKINAKNSLFGDTADAINGSNINNIFNNSPKLKPLSKNGGLTANHIPEADSPAIDAGSNLLYSGNVDQRGKPRVVGGTIDIGSVERQINEQSTAVLTLVKNLSNTNGGSAKIDDFILNASGSKIISGISGSTKVTQVELPPGTYQLGESSVPGYEQVDLSCTGSDDTNLNDGLTLKDSEVVTCTFFNADQPAKLTLKTVLTNNTGSATIEDFTLFITSPDANSGPSGSNEVTDVNLNAGLYFISEQTKPDYILTSIQCTDRPDELISGEGRNIALKNGDVVSCTFTNDYRPARLTMSNAVINDNNGNAVNTDWLLKALGPVSINGKTGDNEINSVPIRAGVYNLEVDGPDAYQTSWQCTGGQLVGNKITLKAGDKAVCNAIMDDIDPIHSIPTLNLIGLLGLISSFVALFSWRQRKSNSLSNL